MTQVSTKYLHSLVTKASYRLGYDSPRDLYHVIFDLLSERHGFVAKDCKVPKLVQAIKQGLYVPTLEYILFYTRQGMEHSNKGILTGNPTITLIDGVRHYEFNNNFYPSVTTILDATGDGFKHKYIQQWKDNLTAEFGEKISLRKQKLPTAVGDFTHDCIELVLLNSDDSEKLKQRTMVKYLLPILDQIEEVIAIELPVYHPKFKYAGRIDCVARMKDGSILLLDWKTSSKKKTPSSIKDYWQQTAAYALALYHNHGIKVDGIQICIMYRSLVGKRNPVRHDFYRRDDIRPDLDLFLERTKTYHNRQKYSMVVPF